MINICKTMNPTNKIVIYCDSPSLIFNIITILNENQISTIMPQDNIITSETLSLFKIHYISFYTFCILFKKIIKLIFYFEVTFKVQT